MGSEYIDYIILGGAVLYVLADWILAIVTGHCHLPGLKCRACKEEEDERKARSHHRR